MESEGILMMFKRSVELNKVRYRPFIGDGNSSSYSVVKKAMPHGQLCFIEKAEFTNRVAKRMGSGLQSLIKDNKGKRLSDRKSLSGRLTLEKCDAM